MKRPAYARELLAMRRAGTHPPVDLIVGRGWTPRPGTPVRLALATEDAAAPDCRLRVHERSLQVALNDDLMRRAEPASKAVRPHAVPDMACPCMQCR